MIPTPSKTLSIALAGLCLLPGASMAQQQFRILFACKPNYDVPGYGSYSMTNAEIDAARTAYLSTFPKMVKDHTGNVVNVRPTFIVMPRTLTTTGLSRGVNQAPVILPEDMPPGDLTDYYGTYAKGWYDHNTIYAGISQHIYMATGYCTPSSVIWSCQNRRTDLNYDDDSLAGAWHEWLHGWETYYKWDKGYDTGGVTVHNASDFGYTATSGGLKNWIGWYRDVSLRTVNGGTGGWGPPAWNTYGTPRSRFTDTAPTLADNTYYRIEARHSSRPLNVSGSNSNNGAPLIQWQYSTGTGWNEQFKRVDLGGGYFALRPRHSNAAVEVPSGNITSGAPVQQYAYNGGTNQQWSAIYRGNGHFGLINRQSGLGMNLSGASTAANASVVQWGGGNADHEQFRLIAVQ
ncbi:RICIN domain-containing protein [Luteolibacter sp. LG18]|uniref:RICIN domain-containing protein n=1 Tax=Luteolibacter sp. LG18 TaxID=2819286 RepID=UPI002B29AA98|nr:hypothetical protein llg_42140 [Luteolibacter sp. LG18]